MIVAGGCGYVGYFCRGRGYLCGLVILRLLGRGSGGGIVDFWGMCLCPSLGVDLLRRDRRSLGKCARIDLRGGPF